MLITRKEDLVDVPVSIETNEMVYGGTTLKYPGSIICEHELSRELKDYFYGLWYKKKGETK